MALLRSFYAINRETWPTMTRWAAFVDAVRLTWRVRAWTEAGVWRKALRWIRTGKHQQWGKP
jgi:hypothetical protein